MYTQGVRKQVQKGESVDVRALRARFHAKADMAGSRDSTSPKPPLRGFGRGGPWLADVSVTANGEVRNKLMLMVPTPTLPGSSYSPDLQRLPPRHVRAELEGMSTSPEPHGVFPHLPPSHRPHRAAKELPRPAPSPTNIDQQGRVRVTGELLQNMMLKHKGVHPGPTKPTPPSLPSQRNLTGVTPLRRALPPEAPSPIKPRRPPHINLQAHQRNTRAPHLAGRPGLRKTDGGSSQSLPGLVSPSAPPSLPTKPSSLPRQCTPVHFEDDQGGYDDVGLDVKPPPPPLNHPGSWDMSDSWNDNSSSQVNEGSDGSDVYKGSEQEVKKTSSDKKKQKEFRWQQEQEKRNQKKRLERDNKYRKKFKLGTGDIEVLHMGRVRHDWQGGKHDLSVRQGNRVEIIRVKNNPEGRWLARTQTGTYGYIISTCVDVDYEEVKCKLKLSRAPDPSLPQPPPPVPFEDNDVYYDVDSSGNMNSLDPIMRKMLEKDEKEFRKKFKFEGPILVLHSMMVDPNASIKKTGGTDLAVVQGEILEVIQVTSDKKALCRNKQGKYGYVPRVLLQVEGDDVYDDVDHINDRGNDDDYEHGLLPANACNAVKKTT
ncbi:FYN-binding protein 1 isoform X2 [Salmo salar]|uniref:FYN-binding protein 1 isoform X2 n=1 Tax=Salmo salar TaxID=8030 RepID=A0A1S3T6Z9_SALSA|nr:FYN-binding protein 1-like isoform X2 [Salmo salar]